MTISDGLYEVYIDDFGIWIPIQYEAIPNQYQIQKYIENKRLRKINMPDASTEKLMDLFSKMWEVALRGRFPHLKVKVVCNYFGEILGASIENEHEGDRKKVREYIAANSQTILLTFLKEKLL